MSNQSRVQQGIPTGGQFATTQRGETDVELCSRNNYVGYNGETGTNTDANGDEEGPCQRCGELTESSWGTGDWLCDECEYEDGFGQEEADDVDR